VCGGDFEEFDKVRLHGIHDIGRQCTAMAVLGHTTISQQNISILDQSGSDQKEELNLQTSLLIIEQRSCCGGEYISWQPRGACAKVDDVFSLHFAIALSKRGDDDSKLDSMNIYAIGNEIRRQQLSHPENSLSHARE
jgi:hypothetical protein